eukprot:Polyplicarium_translucidae@DN3079_c0_g2_i1.p1
MTGLLEVQEEAFAGLADQQYPETEEFWDTCMEGMRDARPGKRVPVLAKALHCLSHSYRFEWVDRWKFTLFAETLESVRKGDQREAILACQLLAIASITLGKDEIPLALYDECSNKLQYVASRGLHMKVRMAAASVFGVVCLIGCDDPARFEESLRWFEQRAAACKFTAASQSKVAAEAMEAEGVLRGWLLLATTFSGTALAQHYEKPAGPLWTFALKCVAHSGFGLQLVAGEAIALMMEAKWKSFTTVSVEKAGKRHPDEIAILRQLASTSGTRERSRGLSKTEKREQLGTFRAVISTVDEGESPEVMICVGSRARTLTLTGWTAVSRYETIRSFLRGAFADHLRDNPSLVGLIGVDDQGGVVGGHVMETDETALGRGREREAGKRRLQDRRRKQRSIKEHQTELEED